MSNIVSNQTYDKLSYSKGKITYHDYVTNKLDNVHNMLFDDALQKYMLDKLWIDSKEEFYEHGYNELKQKYRIIDIKREIYFEPSIAKLIPKYNIDGKKLNIDLTQYWNNDYVVKNIFLDYRIKPIANNLAEYGDTYRQDTTNINNARIYDAEIIEWDYVRGRAKLRSRVWNIEFYIDYKYINSDVKEAESLSIDNTLASLIRKNKTKE